MAIEKEIKRLNLVELVDYVQSDAGKITEANQEEMIRMISVNIFRCLPPGPHEITGTVIIEIDEDDPYLDPAWPHLQLVYVAIGKLWLLEVKVHIDNLTVQSVNFDGNGILDT